MGKGNRAKQARANNILAGNGNKRNNKKTMPTWVGTAIVAGILVVAILSAVLGVLGSRGVFVRGKVVAATANFEITVPMMSYLVYTEYQDWVSTYESTGYMQYIKGSGGDSLNTSIGLRDQNYSVTTDETTGLTTTMTWFDYFANAAATGAEQVLIYCECAKAMGMTLDEEDHKEIDQAIQMLELYAAIYGYTTSGYLSMQYGSGVSLKDIRAMMELSELATKYSEHRQDELDKAATSDRVNTFYENNKADYDTTINYIGITFESAFSPAKDTDADATTKNEEAYAKYQAEQKKFADRITALKECKDPDAFSALLLTYFEEDATAAGEEDPKAVALQKLQDATYINYSKPSSPSDMDSWLFSTTKVPVEGEEDKTKEEPRAVNDTNSFKSEKDPYSANDQKYSAATSTYSACIVTQSLHRNDTKVRDVGHILLKLETYKDLTDTSKLSGEKKTLADSIIAGGSKVSSETMAKALLKKMFDEGAIVEKTTESGETYYEITKEKFEEYAEDFNEDSNVFYEEVKKGEMVAPFEDWLFSATHENEISYPAAVDTTSSSYGHHIMLYLGEGEETWFVTAKAALVEDDYEKWYEDLQKKHNIQFNNLKHIDG